ncbi:MAG TPA: DUF3105 domain-containing protein [Mycobacteriales bacterium]
MTYEPLAAPSRSRRGCLPVVLAVLGAGAALAAVGVASRDDRPSPAASGGPAGCTAERSVPYGSDVSKHVEGVVSYDDVPPASGPHSPVPLSAARRVITREGAPLYVAERAVHNLEHGYVVVWYDTRATDDDVDAVAKAVRAVRQHKVLLVPWTHGGWDGPAFVVTAWGHQLPCARPDTATIEDFYGRYGGPNGEAPEPSAN